jgi:hypothetical protein
MAQCRYRVMLATMLSSHARDDATEATWPRPDVDAELCWRQYYRVMLSMVLQLKVVLAEVRLHSPRDQSIKVLLHHEEVRYSCWLVAE